MLCESEILQSGSEFAYGYDETGRVTAITHSTEDGEKKTTITDAYGNTAVTYTVTLRMQQRETEASGKMGTVVSDNGINIRSGAERIALNTPIQGTAADLIKLAMIRVDAALGEHFPQAKLLLQVHDELIVECPEEIAPQVAALVSREMENTAVLSVPLVAEAKWGKSWYEAK